jgi:predicted nucleotidyltransferase
MTPPVMMEETLEAVKPILQAQYLVDRMLVFGVPPVGRVAPRR